MKLLRYEFNGVISEGILLNNQQVLPLQELSKVSGEIFAYENLLFKKDLRTVAQSMIDQLGEQTLKERTVDVSEVEFLPPVKKPGKIMAIGTNYKAHADEQDFEVPEKPISFGFFDSSLLGHNRSIPVPQASNQVDYEAELAVVIGKECKRVNSEDAFEVIAGYTCLNDISARDLQFQEGQWIRAKSLDGFTPMGPYFVTVDEIQDPDNLDLSLRLNGEMMQSANTKDLIFNIGEIIEYLSEDMTFYPGDVIATGTPGGVGVFRDPQVFLKDGDTLEVEIEGVGTLKNTMKR